MLGPVISLAETERHENVLNFLKIDRRRSLAQFKNRFWVCALSNLHLSNIPGKDNDSL